MTEYDNELSQNLAPKDVGTIHGTVDPNGACAARGSVVTGCRRCAEAPRASARVRFDHELVPAAAAHTARGLRLCAALGKCFRNLILIPGRANLMIQVHIII